VRPYLLLLASVLSAQSWTPLPDGGQSMLGADGRLSAPATLATAQKIQVDGMPFTEALRIQINATGTQVWDAQIIASTTGDVKAGDALLMSLYVRGASPANETGEGRATAYLQRNNGDFAKVVTAALTAGSNWRQVLVPVKSEFTIPNGQHQFVIHLAYLPQTLEIGGITLTNYRDAIPVAQLPRSKITYPGQEPDAPWRAEADARIDQLRKADMRITIVDADGAPIPGAQVHVRMTRHEFGFGSAVAADGINPNNADGAKYRETIKTLFNKAVLENDLKWPSWEANRTKALAAINWLRDNGITNIRGHNLVWPNWQYLPADLPKLAANPPALRERILAHIADEVSATRGLLPEWDVLNEAYTNTDLQAVLGNDEMAVWFKKTAEADPQPTLYINDYSILSNAGLDTPHQDGYFKIIKKIIDDGAPLGGIGMQGHFGAQLTSVPKIWQILDRFSEFQKAIQITEFDIDVDDEELQGAYTRDFMTAIFAHRSIAGFMMWGFWEGRHWRPRAAMFRKDWTRKPNGDAFTDLVFNKWWTDQTANTAEDGAITLRGFKGAYTIDVTFGETTKSIPATLDRGGLEITIPLP
jgi:GH35 family endo-1,4-beta-xylanase